MAAEIIFAGIYCIAYILVIWCGSVVVRTVLGKFSIKDEGLKDAGRMIGILERMLIMTFVFLNQYATIALILTAKSIARFEGLKKREFAEYYLIGTLSSILFAIIIGILTVGVIQILI